MISKQTTKANKGQVGVGTLIVFIAIVLVAAIVASVLISVVEIISDRGTETAVEGVEEVSNKVVVTGVFGVVNGTGDGLDEVRINIRRSSGAQSVNLNGSLIDFADADEQYFLTPGGSNQVTTAPADPSANVGTFRINGLVNDAGGLDGGPFILQSLQDRAEITVTLEDFGTGGDQPEDLQPGENFDLGITTGSGAETIESGQAPRLLPDADGVVRLDR